MTNVDRTGWRDELISDRHRMWGVNCPATDLDLVLLEYDRARATAVIEYKHALSAHQPNHPSVTALADFAGDAGRPAFIVRYHESRTEAEQRPFDQRWTGVDEWEFVAVPLNLHARAVLPGPRLFNEPEYVRWLYQLRGRQTPPQVIERVSAGQGVLL